MSQISKWKDFQGGLWVLEVTYQGPKLTFLYGRQLATTYHFKTGAVIKYHNQFYNLGFLISMFCWWSSLNMRNSKSVYLVAAASRGRLKECNQE